jgi:hypothetical protein
MTKQTERGWFLSADAINDIQNESLARSVKRCKQAHFTDLQIRINGEFEAAQADWIKHLRPITLERAEEVQCGKCQSIRQQGDGCEADDCPCALRYAALPA